MKKTIALFVALLPCFAHADEIYQNQGAINKILASIPVNVEGYKTLKDQVKRFDTQPSGIIVERVTKSNIGDFLPDDRIGDVKYSIYLAVFFPKCVMKGRKIDILKRDGEFFAQDLASNYLLNGVCKTPQ